MKLYATTTSERASKGQGGKEIHFSLQDENQNCVMEMFIEVEKRNIIVRDFWAGDMNTEEIENFFKKGNQQKDEICSVCKDVKCKNHDCIPL